MNHTILILKFQSLSTIINKNVVHDNSHDLLLKSQYPSKNTEMKDSYVG